MKRPFVGVEKNYPRGKLTLNIFLRISSYYMASFWLIASLGILGYESGDFLSNHDNSSTNWYCAVWPKRGTMKYPCLEISWYVLELTTTVINSVLLVLVTVGMVKRKYLLMVPWIIFQFTTMLVSSSAFHIYINYEVCCATFNCQTLHNFISIILFRNLMSIKRSKYQGLRNRGVIVPYPQNFGGSVNPRTTKVHG